MGYFHNKQILFFDESYSQYSIAIEKSIIKQGGNVNFVAYNAYKGKSRFIKRATNKLYFEEKGKRLYDIVNSLRKKSYDFIFIKAPYEAPHDFFDYLFKTFKNVPKINYNWVSVKQYNYLSYREYFDRLISFDPKDAENYNMEYYPLFFIDNYFQARQLIKQNKNNYDILFIGSAYSAGRYTFLNKFNTLCNEKDLKTYIYLYASLFNHTRNSFFGKKIPNVHHTFLSHSKIIDLLSQSQAVIDYPMDIQNGLTMRTFETLGAGVKLITTNKQIKNEPFYSKNNILLLEKDLSDFSLEFLNKSQNDLAPNIDDYHIDNWIKKIITDDF